jgi:hypothetical protein
LAPLSKEKMRLYGPPENKQPAADILPRAAAKSKSKAN